MSRLGLPALLLLAGITLSAQSRPDVLQALQRYAAGDFAAAGQLASDRIMVTALIHDMERWVGHAEPADQLRRRSIAAAFALEKQCRESRRQGVRRTGGTLQRLERAATALTRIITNFRSSYVLRYTPKERPSPGWHELRVRVTRPGSFTIRARSGYEMN